MLPDFGAVQAAAEFPAIVALHRAGATAVATVHYVPLRKAGRQEGRKAGRQEGRKAGKKEWA